MLTATLPLRDAAFDALQAAGIAAYVTPPRDAALPYVVFAGDTETDDAFLRDVSGAAIRDTLTLRVFGATLRAVDTLAAEALAALAGLEVEGFQTVEITRELSTRLDDPAVAGQPPVYGRVLTLAFTLNP